MIERQLAHTCFIRYCSYQTKDSFSKIQAAKCIYNDHARFSLLSIIQPDIYNQAVGEIIIEATILAFQILSGRLSLFIYFAYVITILLSIREALSITSSVPDQHRSLFSKNMKGYISFFILHWDWLRTEGEDG